MPAEAGDGEFEGVGRGEAIGAGGFGGVSSARTNGGRCYPQNCGYKLLRVEVARMRLVRRVRWMSCGPSRQAGAGTGGGESGNMGYSCRVRFGWRGAAGEQ